MTGYRPGAEVFSVARRHGPRIKSGVTVWALLLWPASALRVVLGMLAYGAAIEVAQWAVGWRFGEWADWAADAVGVLSAWGACRAWTSSRA